MQIGSSEQIVPTVLFTPGTLCALVYLQIVGSDKNVRELAIALDWMQYILTCAWALWMLAGMLAGMLGGGVCLAREVWLSRRTKLKPVAAALILAASAKARH